MARLMTYRPGYMNQSEIPVFQTPRIDSQVIFQIPLGELVELAHPKVFAAVDPLTDSPYFRRSGGTITLYKIRYKEKVGFVNKRWLKKVA
jgi:hypothetical protein